MAEPPEPEPQPAPVDMLLLEQQKENIVPLKQGRKASVLTSLYESFDSEVVRSKHLAKTRAAFEAELAPEKLRELDDPLDVHHRYVKWIQESYPGGQNADSDLVHVLERALVEYRHDARYRSDPRYLRLWLLYATLSGEPLNAFQFLVANRIGEDLAALYEAHAAELERARRITEADAVFQRGLARRAQPFERLSRKYVDFQRRLALAVLVDDEAPPPDEPSEPGRVPFMTLGGRELGTSVQAAPAQPLQPRAPKGLVAEDAQDPPSPSAASGWAQFGTVASRRQENWREPQSWASAGPLASAAPLDRAAPRLEVYQDPAESVPAAPSGGSSLQSGGFARLAASKTGSKSARPERLFADLSLLVDDSGEELSIEEARFLRDPSLSARASFGSKPLAVPLQKTPEPRQPKSLHVSPTINTKAALADVYDWFSAPLAAEQTPPKADAGGNDTLSAAAFNLAQQADAAAAVSVFCDPTVTLSAAAVSAAAAADPTSVENTLEKLQIGDGDSPEPFNPLDEEHLAWLLYTHATLDDPLLELARETDAPAVPRSGALDTLQFGARRHLRLRGALGSGGYARVYLASDTGDSNAPAALKVQPSTVPWEHVLLQTAHARLPSETRARVVQSLGCVQYRSETHLLLELCPARMTLLDAVNSFVASAAARTSGGGLAGLGEKLALQLAAELLDTVAALHACDLIHGDLKADNVMVELGTAADAPTLSLKLIDWGRGMDLRRLAPKATLASALRAGDGDPATECWELRCAAPYTFEPDWYGLAGVLHIMLFGQYLRVDQAGSWGDENSYGASSLEGYEIDRVLAHAPDVGAVRSWAALPQWPPAPRGQRSELASAISQAVVAGHCVRREVPRLKLASPLRRYWQRHLWAPLFDLLLNSGVYSRAMRAAHQQWLDEHPFAAHVSSSGARVEAPEWRVRGLDGSFRAGGAARDPTDFATAKALKHIGSVAQEFLAKDTHSSTSAAAQRDRLVRVLSQTSAKAANLERH